jgi:hypothetical protein
VQSLENPALSVLEEEMDQDGIEDLINDLAAELNWNPAPWLITRWRTTG